MAEENRPPHFTFLSAAGGGFVGAFVAIILLWLFAGPICCDNDEGAQTDKRPAAATSATPAVSRPDHRVVA